MNDKFVSIIIPIYNQEKLLSKAVESVINQTYRNIEIILINDGSTDRTYNICQEFLHKDKRIKFLNKNNEGSQKARLDGVNIATGEYIFFLDSDDYIEETLIEDLLTSARKSNYPDMVRSGLIRENLGGKVVAYFGMPNYISENELYTRNFFINKILFNKEGSLLGIHIKHIKEWLNSCKRGDISNSWNYSVATLYKNDVLKAIISFIDTNISIGEDSTINTHFYLNSNSMIFCNVKKYHYVQTNDSLTRNRNSRLFFLRKILLYESRLITLQRYNFPPESALQCMGSICLGFLQCVLVMFLFQSMILKK